MGLCYRSLLRNKLSSEEVEQCPELDSHASMTGIKCIETKCQRISVVMGKKGFILAIRHIRNTSGGQHVIHTNA